MRDTLFKEGYKICKTCNRELPENAEYFVKATNTKSGLGAMCRQCKHEKYMENRDHYIEKSRRYYQENKDIIAEKMKEYHIKNKEHKKEYDKKYRGKNKEVDKERLKKYYEENKDKLREYRKKYYEENKDKIKETNNKWKLNNIEKVRLSKKKRKNKKETTLMKKSVYAIRDNKLGTFQIPVLIENDAVAVRQFGDLIIHGGDNVMSLHPADFSLYRLGEFDCKSGKFENLDCPASLATGSDFAINKEIK